MGEKWRGEVSKGGEKWGAILFLSPGHVYLGCYTSKDTN